MPNDDGVVAALEGALERDPGNTALVVHLAELLLAAGRPADALARCREVLAREPGHDGALAVAEQALGGEGEGPGAPEPEPAEPQPDPEPEAEPATVVPLRVVDGGAGDDVDAEIERPTVKLEDVGGLEDVKRKLNTAFLGPMRNPELRKA